MAEPFEEAGYILRDFSYHLSEIGRGLVNLLEYLLENEDRDIPAGDFLRRLVPIEIHSGNLPLLLREIDLFQKKYEAMKNMVKENYSRDIRTPLTSNDRVLIKITLAELLEHAYSLITTGLGSLPSPSTNIPAGIFPKSLRLKVKIGKDETVINKTFAIGRLEEDYIGIRSIPYEMSLRELIEKAENDTEIRRFPILFKSREKIERKEYWPITSRIHVIIYHDGHHFRILDISSSETIVEIDGKSRKLIGHRAKPYMPLLSLPLGENNKLWIDPIREATGTPIEITVLR
jgi:hypothetical protein